MRLQSASFHPALLLCALATTAVVDSVPFSCVIKPGEEMASVMMTNSLDGDATCIVTCKFSTTKHDNNPQITCAKPVPAGKEVEMCELSAGGDRFLTSTAGSAECARLR